MGGTPSGLRAVLSSGQAVVMHRLAVMSKDGDWILREDDEALEHILAVLDDRGARDLIRLAEAHRELIEKLAEQRPLLLRVADGREALERALDAERRALIRRNEERLATYKSAMQAWAEIWPEVAAEIADHPLRQAHARIVARAEGILPRVPPGLGEAS